MVDSCLKEPSSGTGLDASLFYRTKKGRWGGKIKKIIITVSCKYFLVLPDSRYVLISSFLQPLTSGPGQDVSCVLNKGF